MMRSNASYAEFMPLASHLLWKLLLRLESECRALLQTRRVTVPRSRGAKRDDGALAGAKLGLLARSSATVVSPSRWEMFETRRRDRPSLDVEGWRLSSRTPCSAHTVEACRSRCPGPSGSRAAQTPSARGAGNADTTPTPSTCFAAARRASGPGRQAIGAGASLGSAPPLAK